ncbi:MAG: hypothetical protein ABI907_01480 [Ramlibacter sp.]
MPRLTRSLRFFLLAWPALSFAGQTFDVGEIALSAACSAMTEAATLKARWPWKSDEPTLRTYDGKYKLQVEAFPSRTLTPEAGKVLERCTLEAAAVVSAATELQTDSQRELRYSTLINGCLTRARANYDVRFVSLKRGNVECAAVAPPR